MNLKNILEEYLHRIPEASLALILGAITFRVYLYFLKDAVLKRVLADKLWGFVIIFLLVTRFSALILHPSNLLSLSIFQILSGPAASGWVLGLLVSSTYATWALYKERVINPDTLYLVTVGLLLASIPVFVYQLCFDLYPYFFQDIIRLGLTTIMLLSNLSEQIRSVFRKAPQRLLLMIGASMLATSLVTPQIDKYFLFSAGQWVAIFLILLALVAEAMGDMGQKNKRPAEDKVK